MWVIYCKQTGEEIDRVEHKSDALNVSREFDDTNSWEYTSALRLEA